MGKEKRKIEKSCLLKSGNMASVCNWLEEGYILHPYDEDVLPDVVEKIHHLLDQVESQINKIKVHICLNINGRTLKREWQVFHHVRLIDD